MKFSNETIQILKNFSTINQNILFREGNTVATITDSRNIFARAKIAETFPMDIPVYDLPQMLSILTFQQDQEIEFHEQYMTIAKHDGEFCYYYSDPAVVTAAPDKEIPVDARFSFRIEQSEIVLINKSAALVGAEYISLVNRGGKVTLLVGDPDQRTSNSYTLEIGETEDTDFVARISVETFKVLPDTYDVTLARKSFMHFKNAAETLQYWIALDTKSKI